MRLGLYVDLRNPPEWERPWERHYARWLELIEEADRLGAGAVWLAEHHDFEDGYLPAPMTFAAAVAARTSRIRIGTAVLVGPVRHPRMIAEEAGLVDLISGGRMELGVGAGTRRAEYELFGADFDARMASARTVLAQLRDLLAGGTMRPPTLQQPIPLWAGFRGLRGARFAGELGIGLLDADRSTFAAYREALVGAGNNEALARLGHPAHFLLADDPPRAWARIAPHYAYMWRTYLPSGVDAAGEPLDPQRWLGPDARGAELALPGRTARFEVLTPAEAEVRIRADFAGMPVEHVFCWASIAGMDDDLVVRHIELLSGELSDRLADFSRSPASLT